MHPYIISLLLTFYGTTFSQVKPLPADVIASIHQRLQAGTNPSIVVGVIDQDGPRYYSFGKKKARGKKVNEHTIYEIGSISKVFTGILLADMVIRKEMDVDDPIENYLPAHVKIPTYDGTHITLGNLSDHTSSLPRLPDNFSPADQNNPYADYSVNQMYEFLSSYELKKPIGSEYEYSNLAVGLLGHILALQADKTYEDLMISTIATPLNMNETRIKFSKKMKKSLAIGHNQGEPVANWDLPTLAGAGAIRSSVYDMLKFIGANLDLYDHPLQQDMLLTHKARLDKAGGSRVGLGWHIEDGKDGDVIWHNGATGGYSAFAGFVKEKNYGVIVMTNSTENVDDIGFHLLDPNSPLRQVIPHIAIKLKEIMDSNHDVDLPSMYDEFKKTRPDQYDYSELGINSLGYYYLNRKDFDKALAVFSLNIREYPESSNVYDSYGEVLMEQGDKERAIMNYQKSLELNPGNTNAVAMLEKMGVKAEVKEIEMDDSILSSYTGTYELAPGFELVITKEGNQLNAQATNQPMVPIFPKSSTEFYLKVVNAQIKFNRNSEGKVESLTLYQGGRDILGKKIK